MFPPILVLAAYAAAAAPSLAPSSELESRALSVWPVLRPAPAVGPARRAAVFALDQKDVAPSLLAAHWRVGGLPMPDALPPEVRPPTPRSEPLLVAAWPGLAVLPEPALALIARYPCPPPAQAWLVSGLVQVGAGLGAMVAGEVLENRMMATDSEERARRLFRLGVASSFGGLAVTVSGLGTVAGTSLLACEDR